MSACSRCTFLNCADWVACAMCGAVNPVHVEQDAQLCACGFDGEGTVTTHFDWCPANNIGWSCPSCTFWQDFPNPRCPMCETLNPALVNLCEENKAPVGLQTSKETQEVSREEIDRLHAAVREGQEAAVTQLLKEEFAEQGFDCGPALLRFALSTGYEHVALRLLEFDPRLLAFEGGGPAFFLAARHGRADMAAQLLAEAAAGGDCVDADLIEKTSSLGETALQLAARVGQPQIVALLLSHRPTSVTKACWSALNNEANSEAHEQVLRLLLEYDPSLIQRVDFRGNTILHYVSGGGKRLFRPELITLIWSLHPPALHTANICGVTPFQRAVWSNNEFALRFFQEQLPLDQGMSCVTSREFLDSHCAQPLQALPRVLLDTVYEYLGFQPLLGRERAESERRSENRKRTRLLPPPLREQKPGSF